MSVKASCIGVDYKENWVHVLILELNQYKATEAIKFEGYREDRYNEWSV